MLKQTLDKKQGCSAKFSDNPKLTKDTLVFFKTTTHFVLLQIFITTDNDVSEHSV